ncbi:hypothetical protein [Pseudonocardia sp. H11422]|nr:hypothetical protein [Pseudonocardia sp. H11422]
MTHRAGGNLSGARVICGGVRLWFGPDDAPVLLLAPVPLTEFSS